MASQAEQHRSTEAGGRARGGCDLGPRVSVRLVRSKCDGRGMDSGEEGGRCRIDPGMRDAWVTPRYLEPRDVVLSRRDVRGEAESRQEMGDGSQ